MFKGVWVNIQVFDSILLINLSVFRPIPSCFHYCRSVIELDVRDGDSSRSFFIVLDCFGHPGVFVFPNEAGYFSFEVCEELCWDFDGDYIESIDCLW